MFRRLQHHIHHVFHHTTSLNTYMIHVIGKYPLFSFGPGKFSSLAHLSAGWRVSSLLRPRNTCCYCRCLIYSWASVLIRRKKGLQKGMAKIITKTKIKTSTTVIVQLAVQSNHLIWQIINRGKKRCRSTSTNNQGSSTGCFFHRSGRNRETFPTWKQRAGIPNPPQKWEVKRENTLLGTNISHPVWHFWVEDVPEFPGWIQYVHNICMYMYA